MTVDIGTPVAHRPAQSRRRAPAPPRDLFNSGLVAVIGAQAIWFGLLISRGWFYEADFDNLASATGRPLTISYLTQAQGGHLGIAGRLVFWVLNRLGPLDHPLTIALRLLAQATATWLLARLLVLLVGKRTGVLAVVALYAFSPLLVQSTLWLTASVGFLSSQIFVLLALIAHVHYEVTRRLRWAAAAAGALIAATVCAEQAAVIALVLPVLSIAYLYSGSPRERMRTLLRGWPEWAMAAGPIVAFAGVVLGSGKYHSGPIGMSFGAAVSLIGREFGTAIAPTLVGGPFHWDPVGHHYFAFAAPTLELRLISALVVLRLVVLTVQRTGWRALAAWAMPVLVAGVGIVVVAIGRYHGLGTLITQQLEHAAFTAVPAAVALALAWWPTTPQQIAARATGAASPVLPPLPPPPRHIARAATARRRAAVAAVAAVLVSSLITELSYSSHWSKAPARRYVDNLAAALRAQPHVNLFDTFVDGSVLPGVSTHRHISDLTALMGRHPQFDQPSSTPLVVAPDGRVVPATFLRSAAAIRPLDNSFCSNPVAGLVDRTESLDQPLHATEWYLRIGFFQQHASTIHLWLVDNLGHETAPVGGELTVLPGTLGVVFLRFAQVDPVSVHIRSESAATNVCLTDVSVGYPFARQS